MENLLSQLGYASSLHHKLIHDWNEPETAHLSHLAANVDVKSVYLLETSSSQNNTHQLPARPVVYVAEANTPEHARQIHKKIWNLNSAPFLIIKLPDEVRVYTSFSYSTEDEDIGLHKTVSDEKLWQIAELLQDISADSIDSGHIWQSELGKQADIDQRVDKRLLRNLRALEKALQDELPLSIIHALIGKYIYLRYLRDRDILSDKWLNEQGLSSEQLFTHQATIQSLQTVIDALQARFNGQIFPLDFDDAMEKGLTDKHISWVASIFSGGKFIENTPDKILQLQLPFEAYNFYYIPVETLSAIYEQFIDNRKEKGAVYTPEYLADYVLSEVESVQSIHSGGKLLDPACGSGVFLVLAYRRLIEKEIKKQSRPLEAEELKQLLLGSIYGVERELEACRITEFSLILTLLHYIDPPYLHSLPDFKFPVLFNSRIFRTDFFDITDEVYQSGFWPRGLQFDWVVGNPPWASRIKEDTDGLARQWIDESSYPVADYRVAEAFSWLATELLAEKGVVGFLLPATSLFNKKSVHYREKFLHTNLIHKITNFTNMRETLFGKTHKNVLPAMSVIYETATEIPPNHRIVHYAPFTINQTIQDNKQPWTLTINASEISSVKQTDARDGNSVVWKMTLWGNLADQALLEKIEWNFPNSIGTLAEEHKWVFSEAAQLRHKSSDDELIHLPELLGVFKLNKNKINSSPYRFSFPEAETEKINEMWCYIRKRGGQQGVGTIWSPHIFISARAMDTILYSEEDFVIPARNIGISASKNPATTLTLKALATYLNASIVPYWLFFHVPTWGVFHKQSRLILTSVAKSIPVPEFNDEQVQALADYYDKLVQLEKKTVQQLCLQAYEARPRNMFANDTIDEPISFSLLTKNEKQTVKKAVKRQQTQWQKDLDSFVYDIIGIPDEMRTTIDDFLQIRLPLDNWSTSGKSTQFPSNDELEQYGNCLKMELDEFVMGRAIHHVQITVANDLIECMVDNNRPNGNNEVSVIPSHEAGLSRLKLLSTFSQQLQEQFSQWVYVKRNLRVYDGNRIYIYKSPRLIDWTQTQAGLDAQDIIGHILTSTHITHEA